MGDNVALNCGVDTLLALAEGLTEFGAVDGIPGWLVSGVWLCIGAAQFIATATVEVLSDGYVARVLNICTPDELVRQVERDLPDVSARLLGKGSAIDLGEVPTPISAPASTTPWPPGPYSMSVIVRNDRRASSLHCVASALHFTNERGNSLLVGTDVASIAMVMSEDPELIQRYLVNCDAMSAAQYFERFGR